MSCRTRLCMWSYRSPVTSEGFEELWRISNSPDSQPLMEPAHHVDLRSQVGPELSIVGIVTKGRPIALWRALRSYGENARRWRRGASFVVIDYSERPIARQNIDVCQSVKRIAGVPVRYVGLSCAAGFAACLARTCSIPEGVVRFALGFSASAERQLEIKELTTPGGTRNALMLATAGSKLISVDDDTECITAEPEPRDDRLAVRALPLIFRWSFAQSGALKLRDFDFIGRHAAVLGKSLHELISGWNGGIAFDTGAGNSTGNHRLIVTRSFLGVEGDSGLKSLLNSALFGGANFEDLPEDELAYVEALEAHQCRRWVPQVALGRSQFCMGINMGLDNRAVLPPFFPFQRGQDGLFGGLLDAIEGHACAFLPGTIRHSPLGDRRASVDEIRLDLTRWRVAEYLSAIFNYSAVASRSVACPRAIRRIGEELVGIGRLPLVPFRTLLVSLRHSALSLQIQHIDLLLAGGARSNCVRRDLICARTALSEALSVEYPDLVDLELPPDGRVELMRELVKSYGLLMLSWPDLCECAAHSGNCL